MIDREAMLLYDRIRACGQDAKDDLIKACEKCGIEDHYGFLKTEHVKSYLEIGSEILAKWHTTDKFKVGDKVYVDPGKPTFAFKNYIRATVTEVTTDGWGYHLRAFEQDLPGIYMFNIWDKDLLPRTNKSNKPLTESHFV